MKKLLAICLLSFPLFSFATETTDDEIIRAIITQSIMSYPGTCACPYNRAKNGSKCGKRSAYSRSGGYQTICYPGDVTKEMIEQYKRRSR